MPTLKVNVEERSKNTVSTVLSKGATLLFYENQAFDWGNPVDLTEKNTIFCVSSLVGAY